MTRDEIKNTPEIVDFMLDESIIADSRMKLRKRLEELCKLALKALEQEPRKGHWVLTDVEGNKVWHCNCSECGKDPLNYVGGSENWWLIKSTLPKFCPSCGSDNREVEE